MGLFCVLILLLLTNKLVGQTQESQIQPTASGLLFKSYDYPHQDRTQLDLTAKAPFNTTGKQVLQFELSFWQADKFGYVFRTITSDGDKFDLVYLPEDISLNFVFNEKEIVAKLQLKVDDLIRNHWHLISVDLGETLNLVFNDQKFMVNKEFRLSTVGFGLNYSPENLTIDVPPIAIRQIQYFENETLLHHWPLNEWEGDIAFDKINNWHAKVRNPIWLTNQNFTWEKRYTLAADKIPAITYEANTQKLHIFNKTQQNQIDLVTGEVFVKEYIAPLNLKDQALYGNFNPFLQKHYVYDLEPTIVATIDSTNNFWKYNLPPDSVRQEYWQHASFINPLDSSLYFFGGYGYFLAKNKLMRYDESSGSWNEVALTGDIPDPRYHLAAGPGAKPGEFYLFGGIGNTSGRQELGLKNYYDLFLLDLSTSSIKKIANINAPANHFVPVNGLVFDEQEGVIYMLAYRNYDPSNNNLALLKLGLKSQEIGVYSDSIPYNAHKTDYCDAFLMRAEISNELIAVTRLSKDEFGSSVNVYSLFYPPTKPLLNPSLITKAESSYWYYIVAVIGLLLIALGFIVKVKPAITPDKNIKPKPIENVLKASNSTEIFLFGGFMVKNSFGEEVTKQFSPKLRELFLLLLLHSQKERGGIVTKRLTETIWPIMASNKAKNARGVTMKRLRKVIEQIEGVSISFENDRWKLLLSDQVYCDFLAYESLKTEISENTNAFEEILKSLSGGDFLPNIQTEWLDKEKFLITDDIINSLVGYEQTEVIELSDQQLVNLADTIFQFDDVNENALNIKINALIRLGKNGLANDVYQEFCSRYLKLFNEEFSLSFNEIST